MDRPAEIWTRERLEQAAIDEVVRHGGTKQDLELLRTELDKRRNGKPDDVVRERIGDAQSGDIPE